MPASLFALGCVVGLLPKEDGSNLSALAALKIAQRRLKQQVRESLLIISSRRFMRDRTPSLWRFVFQDLSTTDTFRVVVVSNKTSGQSENLAGFKKETDLCQLTTIDQNRSMIDSDEALRRASEFPTRQWSACEISLIQCPERRYSIWVVSYFEFENGTTAAKVVTLSASTGAIL